MRLADLDRYSLVGGFGGSVANYNVQDLLSNIGMNPYVTKRGEFKADPNPFEPMLDMDKEKLTALNNAINQELIELMFSMREKKLKEGGLQDTKQFGKKLTDSARLTPEELLKLGMIDGIDLYENIKETTAPGVKEIKCNLPLITLRGLMGRGKGPIAARNSLEGMLSQRLSS